MSPSAHGKLAINGGTPVREGPFPPRRLFTAEEKAAAMEVFDEAIETGAAFGYAGPREQAFEKEFAELLGGGLAKAVNSGTSAVLSAVAALELEPGSEVIVPPITDPGGIMPVAMMNCIPVPADGNGLSFNTGPEQVAAALTDRTRAIIVAHIMGEPADMAPLMALARERNLPVIEDCAQAHGATYRGRLVGNFGDIAVFSTMSGKHLATGAQGGVVFTRDEELFWKARRFMDRGKPYGLEAAGNVRLGLNLNSNDLATAIGRVQLRRLPWVVRRRQELVAQIGEVLAELPGVDLPQLVGQAEASYWFLRLRTRSERLSVDKEIFGEALQAEGVPVAVWYGHIPCEHPWFRHRRTYGRSGYPWPRELADDEAPADPDLPNARAAIGSDFLISVHENWSDRELADTAAALRKVHEAYAAP